MVKKEVPTIKKIVSNFFINESGKISKKAIITIGVTCAILSQTVNARNDCTTDHQCHGNYAPASPTSDKLSDDAVGGKELAIVDQHANVSSHANCCDHDDWASNGSCTYGNGEVSPGVIQNALHTNSLNLIKQGTNIVATHQHNLFSSHLNVDHKNNAHGNNWFCA